MDMNFYIKNDLIRLAKRYNNVKRKYLLVNPFQAKHLATTPDDFFGLVKGLSEKIADNSKKYTVIAFAETATAIGFELAKLLGNDTFFITTTRENTGVDHIYFSEEHSHATEQKLCISELYAAIENSDVIVFVDDEITTGKTMINLLSHLRKMNMVSDEKTFICASIINRLTDENSKKLKDQGIECRAIIKTAYTDYSEIMDRVRRP